MKKIFSFFCVVSLLLCSISPISVSATETEQPCTEIEEEPYAGLVSSYILWVSNYNGSLCVNAQTKAPSAMSEIGLKDLTVQYSYDGNKWYDEWNAGDFLAYDTDKYSLSNYIISLERSRCYYRATCKHYAKKSIFNTQSDPNTSNGVWIG